MKYFKAGILIVISLIAIWVITFISGFTYLNQSNLTPMDKQLNFFNYLLPYLLTIGFITYITFAKILKLKYKSNWIVIIFIGTGAIIALPWQFEQLKFLFQKKDLNFIFEISAYLIGLIFTIWTLIEEVRKTKTDPTTRDIS